MTKTYFTPPTHYLVAAAAQHLGWRTALAELIDNAIDKHATRIEITEGPTENKKPTSFQIRDNGEGCPDPVVITTFGSRGESDDDSGLGRFGVGGPEAIMDIGGLDSSVEIASVHEHIARHVRLSWRRLLRTGDWGLEDAFWTSGPSSENGTNILISPVRRPPISKAVRTQLGYTFSPYLKEGNEIIFYKGGEASPLERWELPILEDIIDTRISVDGKTARIYVGIVPAGVRNERAGITIGHRHRVIEEAGGSCCGDYGYQRICGFVMLDRKWDLTKNKTGLNEGASELYAAVHSEIIPILAKGQEQFITVDDAQWTGVLETELNRRLFKIWPSERNDAKAKRGRGSEHGTKIPTGDGGRHRQAGVEQEGATFPSKRGGKTTTRKTPGIKVQLGDFPVGDLRPGTYDPSGHVRLNNAHPRIAADWNSRNLDSLILVVGAIVASDETWARGTSRRFEFAEDGTPHERFLHLYGHALANWRENGQ
jgi:Histidine kinase-, DNA gyrase B-, and HSP90-like ATPase